MLSNSEYDGFELSLESDRSVSCIPMNRLLGDPKKTKNRTRGNI